MEWDTPNTVVPESGPAQFSADSLPKLSFIPSDLITEHNGTVGVREKCAYAGLVIGGISVVSWVVILLGILVSVTGLTLSFLGLSSSRAKHARIGAVLSFFGLVASLSYAFAIYQGKVNYNYFTSEFWGTTYQSNEVTK